MLKENVGGIGGGNLMIAFARPETGKTAFWVSLCAGPDGFAEQGAKIHAFINEEPAIRTQMRAISCYTGMTREEIVNDIQTAQSYWSDIKNNISMFDTVDWSMEDIDSHCEKHKPDIIVIDQLDKINVNGTFATSGDLYFGNILIGAYTLPIVENHAYYDGWWKVQIGSTITPTTNEEKYFCLVIKDIIKLNESRTPDIYTNILDNKAVDVATANTKSSHLETVSHTGATGAIVDNSCLLYTSDAADE